MSRACPGPLDGRTVVVTRASHQAEELARPLREAGAEVMLLPIIEIVPPADEEPLRRAVAGIDRYDWIVFSSANAVAAVQRLLPVPAHRPRGRVAAIGAATCEAVKEMGWPVDVVPGKFVAEALAEAIPEDALRGARVFLPSAEVTREVIPQALTGKGATVDVVTAYRNVMPGDAKQRAENVFSPPFPDWVTFTSSSAVENLTALIGAPKLAQTRIASIGPVTSSSLRQRGLTVAVEAEQQTVPALVQAMERLLSGF